MVDGLEYKLDIDVYRYANLYCIGHKCWDGCYKDEFSCELFIIE